MKVEVLAKSARDFRAIVRETDHATMNAIRRTLLAEVPRLAIEDVTIYDNTSALFDEMLAHRLGLLPVPTEPGLFNFRDQCVCSGEGCANCTVLYTLSKEGPGTVYSGDLTPADPRFAIPDPDIPLVKLLEGQRVMLEAAAQMGNGTRHAKWAAAVAVGYRELPSVKVKDGVLPPALASELAALAPANAVKVQDGRIGVVDVEKAYDFLRAATQRFRELEQHLELAEVPDAFILRVETDGSLTAKAAVKESIGRLMEKLKAVEEQAPKLAKEA